MKSAILKMGLCAVTLGLSTKFAQFTTFATPTSAYTGATTVMTIPGANFSTTDTLTDGTQTLSFSSTEQVRTVPGGGWATWNSPPAVESSTPKVLAIITGLTTMTITLSVPQAIFGFELEPNNGTQTMTATFFNGSTVLGSITQSVVGTSGAKLLPRLLRVRSRALSLACPRGRAVSRWRSSVTATRRPAPLQRSELQRWECQGSVCWRWRCLQAERSWLDGSRISITPIWVSGSYESAR